MQEHIKRMAVEAGFIDRAAFNHEAELTAFAQAVARECQQIADKHKHDLLVLTSNPPQSGAAINISVEIRARFGLEG